MITGKNLINGQWIDSAETIPSFNPSLNAATEHKFAQATTADVDTAVNAAVAAAEIFSILANSKRAEFLRVAADCIDKRGDQINEITGQETALPTARLENERNRTTNQLRLFADVIEKGDYLDRQSVTALPDREPMPRPEMHLHQRPLGPVAIFGASNFPLAFSAAGGDTASALAAGCPVIVKSHNSHPGTCEIISAGFLEAIEKCGLPTGVYSCLSCSNEVAQHLIKHPAITAVGFTGSTRAGRLLFDIACARPQPIPFFAEMGSINPVFTLPAKLKAAAADLGVAWAGSLTLGAGQFCTNPGVLIGIAGADLDQFITATTEALSNAAEHTLLSLGVAKAYRAGVQALANNTAESVAGQVKPDATNCKVEAAIYKVSGEQWLANPALAEEIFGPVGIIVACQDEQQLQAVAESFAGQLTATLHLTDADEQLARKLLPVLEKRVGRLICNGFPTGVEVCEAMMHGGPYPASTNPSHTSVGTLAIRRFLRPVCYQGFPANLVTT